MRGFIILILSLFIGTTIYGQKIEEVYAQGSGDFKSSKLVALLSDHTIWWAAEGKSWERVPSQGLPSDRTIKNISAYAKFDMSFRPSRIIAILDDNAVWEYTEGKQWEKISMAGLPKDAKIKLFRSYTKETIGEGMSTRLVAVLEDNTLWWCAPKQSWKQIPVEGLPEKYVITGIGAYSQPEIGNDTRYFITFADNSIWEFYNRKKWRRLDKPGLPSNIVIKNFAAFVKTEGTFRLGQWHAWNGRLISVLEDESIWWLPEDKKNWQRLETEKLPKNYEVKFLSVFQKAPEIVGECRVVVVLADGSIWWYAENKGWLKFEASGLPVTS